MPQHRPCLSFGLVAIFAGLSLGTRNISKYGCLGNSLELYSNISFNNNFTIVSVYKNGVHNMLIATWSVNNFNISPTFINGYGDKLSLDKKGSIWIYRLHISDEAKYSIKIDKGNGSSDDIVQLGVLVAPTTNCKPKIKRVKDVLTVFVDANVCGRPAATVYWLNHSGIVHTETNAIELQPGKQAGTYHACIEGDALKCAELSRFSDHCSFLYIDEEKPSSGQKDAGIFNNHTVQDQPLPGQERAGYSRDNIVEDMNRSEITTNTVVLPIIALILIAILIVLVVRWIKKQKENPGGEGSPLLQSGETDTTLSNQQVGHPPGNGETSTQLSNQQDGHPPGNGETSTPPSNQQDGHPPGNGETTPLSNQQDEHPPENDESSNNKVGAENETPDVIQDANSQTSPEAPPQEKTQCSSTFLRL